MEDMNEKESSSPKIDPKRYVRDTTSFGRSPLSRHRSQAVLGAFSQPTETGYPRLNFYMMYWMEANKHDAEYAAKQHEDLNATLVFVRCA